MIGFKTTDIGLIPFDWEAVRFQEVAELRHGHQFRNYDFTEDGLKVIKITQIKSDGKIDLSSCSYIDGNRLDEFKNDIIVKGDILVALTGATIGKIARYNSSEIVLQNYRVGNFFSNDEKILNKDFLFQFLRSNYFFNQILARQTQSAQQNIGKDEINNMTLFLPNIEEQRAISSILTALDDKIELLQAQNKTLEETAQTIFAEWFGKYSVDDELPDGYKFGELGDVAINHSKTFKFTNENVVFVNTGDVLEGQFLHSNEISPIGLPGQAKKAIELYDILYSEIRPKNKRFAFVDFDTSNYVVSTKFMIIRPKNDFSPFILYLILKNQDTIDEFNIVAESRSGTFPQITFDAVKSFPIVIPSKEKQNDFDNILLPIMEKKKLNHQQIQTLTKTRDELLPRLMSGEVRVNEFKK